MNLLVKTLVTVGSSASIGFGTWHFFVPTMWKWYAHIDTRATELVVAVRVTNVFFSLSLVPILLVSAVLQISLLNAR